MSGDKVVFLAFNSDKTEIGGIERLACLTCRNKTFLVTYDKTSGFPSLQCACCGVNCGRIGWAEETA